MNAPSGRRQSAFNVAGPEWESRGRFGEEDARFMREFRDTALGRRGLGTAQDVEWSAATRKEAHRLPSHLSPLKRKKAELEAEYDRLQDQLQPAVTLDEMCRRRWHWLGKVHELIRDSLRPARPATAIVLESAAPPIATCSAFVSILTNCYGMNPVKADNVLRQLFKCFDIGAAKAVSRAAAAAANKKKAAAEAGHGVPGEAWQELSGGGSKVGGGGGEAGAMEQEEEHEIHGVVPANKCDMREVVCCLRIIEDPTADAKSQLLCFFDIFDSDSSHVISTRHATAILMLAAVTDAERRATATRFRDALLVHAQRWGLSSQYRTVSDSLFLEVLEENPSILEAVDEQIWKRLSPEYRLEMVQRRGDEIFGRFEEQMMERKSAMAKNAWRLKAVRSTYARWAMYTRNNLAVKQAIRDALIRATKSVLKFWHLYALVRHRHRAKNELAKIEGRRNKKLFTLRRWRLWKDRQVRVRRVLWMTSGARYAYQEGLRKLSDVYLRLWRKCSWHGWVARVLEARREERVVAYIEAGRRRRAFGWWQRYAHDTLAVKRTEFEAEQRRLLMMKEWGDFEQELEDKKAAEAAAAEAAEAEKRRLVAEERMRVAAWERQRKKADVGARDRHILEEQLVAKKVRAKRALAERTDKFNNKWDEIEASGVEETTTKWAEWLQTKDGHSLTEMHGRRLKAAMETPPQDQSPELVELLHSPQGAGQVGSKWKWFEHPVEGVLCYEVRAAAAAAAVLAALAAPAAAAAAAAAASAAVARCCGTVLLADAASRPLLPPRTSRRAWSLWTST
jgi:hypothetical protein